jgi:hypothetical protein
MPPQSLSKLPTKIQNRLSVAEEFGTTPLRILMRFATDPESTRDEIIACAIAAAPYCHAKLKQIEVNDNREHRDPATIARDISHLVERLSKTVSTESAFAGRPRDLIGVTEGA